MRSEAQRFAAVPSPSGPAEATVADYVLRLRSALPREALRPDAAKLVPLALHLAIVVSALAAARAAPVVWVQVPAALAMSASLVCIAFLAHELTHGAIVRLPAVPGYLLEASVWALVFTPATVWRRCHNETHHVTPNTLADTDRPYVESERTRATRAYARLMLPSERAARWNPGMGLHLLGYVVRNTWAALAPAARKPSIATHRPRYRRGDRLRIAFEVALIVGWQYAVFRILASDPAAYAVVVLLSSYLTLAGLGAYIFTNHFLSPIGTSRDPLVTTASLRVPKLLDRLHFHFSHHVEHHLFPSINSDYYPLVATLLERGWPDRYRRLSFGEAWDELRAQPEFRAESQHAVRSDG